MDKKVVAGTTRFVLLDALGKGVVRSDVSTVDIERAIAVAGDKTKTAPGGAALVGSRP
jgi:3-dehydroquinate synthetase